MNEFSFIKLSDTIQSCDVPLPVSAMTDIAHYFDGLIPGIGIVDLDGNYISDTAAHTASYEGSGWSWVHYGGAVPNAAKTGNCFVLRFDYGGGVYKYTNPLFYSENAEYSLFEYYCHETQFGFEYGSTGSTYPNKIRLPLRLHDVQYPQEEKIYVDGNGVRHLLTAKVDKEQELETEYLTDAIHEKIVVMLAHDVVKINGIQYAKSAGYEIDHENEDELSCGTKIHKAKAKMIRNTTLKNTNC